MKSEGEKAKTEIQKLKSEGENPKAEIQKLKDECDKLRIEAFDLNGQLMDSMIEGDKLRLELQSSLSLYPSLFFATSFFFPFFTFSSLLAEPFIFLAHSVPLFYFPCF